METERGEGPRIHLLGAYELIHKHLTEGACQEVFEQVRWRERQKKWPLHALLQFWVAILFDPPRALRHALVRVTGESEDELFPHVQANPGSFFERCQELRPTFFQELYARFTREATPEALQTYGEQAQRLKKRFTEILAIDGSRLDHVAHRLKITWKDRSVLLPGCVLAVYDLLRGIVRGFQFEGDAAKSEAVRVQHALEYGMAGWNLKEGSLLMGDRLYCSLQLFEKLGQKEAWGLFRRNRTIGFRKVRKLRSRRHGGGQLQEWLVEAGSGVGTPVQILRYIRYQKGNLSGCGSC